MFFPNSNTAIKLHDVLLKKAAFQCWSFSYKQC